MYSTPQLISTAKKELSSHTNAPTPSLHNPPHLSLGHPKLEAASPKFALSRLALDPSVSEYKGVRTLNPEATPYTFQPTAFQSKLQYMPVEPEQPAKRSPPLNAGSRPFKPKSALMGGASSMESSSTSAAGHSAPLVPTPKSPSRFDFTNREPKMKFLPNHEGRPLVDVDRMRITPRSLAAIQLDAPLRQYCAARAKSPDSSQTIEVTFPFTRNFIGITPSRDDPCVVASVFHKGEARRFGVQPGWKIVKVNGFNVGQKNIHTLLSTVGKRLFLTFQVNVPETDESKMRTCLIELNEMQARFPRSMLWFQQEESRRSPTRSLSNCDIESNTSDGTSRSAKAARRNYQVPSETEVE